MKNQNSKIVGFILILTVIAALAFCVASRKNPSGETEPAHQDTLQIVNQSKVIHAAYLVYPPTVSVAKDATQPSGFLVDIMNEIAVRAGWKIEYTPTTFDDVTLAASSPNFDIVVGGIFVNVPRSKQMAFTLPIMYWNGVSAISSKTAAPGYATLEDADKPGIKIAVTAGTAEYDFLKQHITKATINAIPNNDISLTLSEVTAGRADIAFADAITIGKFLRNNPNVVVAFGGKQFNTYAVSFVTKLNDQAWLNFLNESLLTLQADGTIDELSHKWGGENIWILPKKPWQ